MSTNKGDEESLSRPQQDDLVPAERRRLERIISNKARLKALQVGLWHIQKLQPRDAVIKAEEPLPVADR